VLFLWLYIGEKQEYCAKAGEETVTGDCETGYTQYCCNETKGECSRSACTE